MKKLFYILVGAFKVWSPFYLHGLTSILAWIISYIHYKFWMKCEDMGENWLHYHGTTHDTVKVGMGIVLFHNDFYMPDESPRFPFLAATKQLYEWSFPSVRPSVCY